MDTRPEQQTGQGGERKVLAMLIDTQNVPPWIMDEAICRAEEDGDLRMILAFGAIQDPRWWRVMEQLNITWDGNHGTTGKNCADMELTIAAMDLLHDRALTGFVIVSEDRDFVPLAMRLRRVGKFVIGIGDGRASAAFVRACDRYEIVGIWGEQTSEHRWKLPIPPSNPGTTWLPPTILDPATTRPSRDAERRRFLDLLARAASLVRQVDGWVRVGLLGQSLRQLKPDIRYADYGLYPDEKKLTDILASFPDQIETRGPRDRMEIRLRPFFGGSDDPLTLEAYRERPETLPHRAPCEVDEVRADQPREAPPPRSHHPDALGSPERDSESASPATRRLSLAAVAGERPSPSRS